MLVYPSDPAEVSERTGVVLLTFSKVLADIDALNKSNVSFDSVVKPLAEVRNTLTIGFELPIFIPLLFALLSGGRCVHQHSVVHARASSNTVGAFCGPSISLLFVDLLLGSVSTWLWTCELMVKVHPSKEARAAYTQQITKIKGQLAEAWRVRNTQ